MCVCVYIYIYTHLYMCICMFTYFKMTNKDGDDESVQKLAEAQAA